MRAVSLLFHDVFVGDPHESGFASKAADRYKLPLRAFDEQLRGITAVRTDGPVLATDLPSAGPKGPALRVAEEDRFLITVDDGGVSYYTLLASRLEARGWRGHCFVSTDLIDCPGFLSAAQICELDARGHLIGSHSASHPARFSACDTDRMRREWSRSRKVLEDLLGHEVRVASVPGGYYSRTVALTAREAGLRVLFTSEPTTTVVDEDGLLVMGRYTIRRRHASGAARRLVQPAPWTRFAEWASWNAKGLVKPLLGDSYRRVADWVVQ